MKKFEKCLLVINFALRSSKAITDLWYGQNISQKEKQRQEHDY